MVFLGLPKSVCGKSTLCPPLFIGAHRGGGGCTSGHYVPLLCNKQKKNFFLKTWHHLVMGPYINYVIFYREYFSAGWGGGGFLTKRQNIMFLLKP